MKDMREYCTFFVGDRFFAVDVALVQEVIPDVPCTRVPLTNPEVAGLINLRGQIVLAIDLQRRLALPQTSPPESQANLIVHTRDGLVSLRVDNLGDVVSLDQQRMEPLPASVQGPMRELVPGVFQWDATILLLLDVSRVATQEVCVRAEESASGA